MNVQELPTQPFTNYSLNKTCEIKPRRLLAINSPQKGQRNPETNSKQYFSQH